MLVGPGQAHDGPMLPHLLAAITVPRLGPGRARTRPDRVVADKAYSSRASRQPLRARKIVAVIAERSDQQANRKRRGRMGIDWISVWRVRIRSRRRNLLRLSVSM